MSRERASKLVESTLGAVLLLYVVNAIQSASEGHGSLVNGRHLRREHGFDLIPWFDALDQRENEVQIALLQVALQSNLSQLPEEAVQEI